MFLPMAFLYGRRAAEPCGRMLKSPAVDGNMERPKNLPLHSAVLRVLRVLSARGMGFPKWKLSSRRISSYHGINIRKPWGGVAGSHFPPRSGSLLLRRGRPRRRRPSSRTSGLCLGYDRLESNHFALFWVRFWFVHKRAAYVMRCYCRIASVVSPAYGAPRRVYDYLLRPGQGDLCVR